MLRFRLPSSSAHASVAVRSMRRSPGAVVAALLVLGLMTIVALGTRPAYAGPAPVFANKAPDGAGLTITPGDLKFILKQIKIAERHAATLTPEDPCGTLVGSDPLQIPERRTPGACARSTALATTCMPARRRSPRPTSPSRG